MPKYFKQLRKKLPRGRRVRPLLFIVLFALVGVAALVAIRAATPTTSFEAETHTGAVAVVKGVDTSASDGQYIQFGAGQVAQPPTGDGPTTYITESELDQVKAKIAAGQQPWKSAYDQLINKANSELNQTPRAVTDNGGGHLLVADQQNTADYADATEMSESIYNLALAWRLSGQAQYGQKALTLLDHWALKDTTYMDPDMTKTSGTARLRVFITANGMVYGADLIWGYGGWSAAQRTEFMAWVSKLGQTGKIAPADNAGSLQNKESWRQSMIAVCAGFTEDEALMNYAFTRFKELLPSQIYAPGSSKPGFLIDEWYRGNPGKGEDGKGGLFYSNYALNAMTQVAQVAWVHGQDLFRYENKNVSLKYAIDTMVPYLLNPASWTVSPTDGLTDGTYGYFEFVYKNLGEPKYLQVVNKRGRPAMLDYGIHGNITVTHGRL